MGVASVHALPNTAGKYRMIFKITQFPILKKETKKGKSLKKIFKVESSFAEGKGTVAHLCPQAFNIQLSLTSQSAVSSAMNVSSGPCTQDLTQIYYVSVMDQGIQTTKEALQLLPTESFYISNFPFPHLLI